MSAWFWCRALPQVILRLVEAFCALVAFSCAAAANKAAQALDVYNWEEFLIATGVIALIFDISFLIVYSRGDRLPPSWAARVPVIELTLSAIWTLFFFIASIGVATLPKQYEGIPIIEPWYYGNARGAAAFGFFSCFAWGASSYLAFRRFRSGSPSGPMQYSDI